MGRYKLEIDVDIKDIPSLDDAHKRDCADAVNKAIGSTFKYTIFFGAASAAFFALYTIFGVFWALRMGRMLPPIPPLIPLAAVLIILLEFAAGTMQGWGIAAEIFVLAGMTAVSVTEFQSLIFVPFALYGIFVHIKLFRLMPFFKTISELPGYPDFTPLPVKEKPKENDDDTAS
ncbi:MAG: hypothetical protein K2H90_07195 [Oscillospiraceae bacterium]|nr:hypothetical protein [Oscillospiraceae bacterium]